MNNPLNYLLVLLLLLLVNFFIGIAFIKLLKLKTNLLNVSVLGFIGMLLLWATIIIMKTLALSVVLMSVPLLVFFVYRYKKKCLGEESEKLSDVIKNYLLFTCGGALFAFTMLIIPKLEGSLMISRLPAGDHSSYAQMAYSLITTGKESFFAHSTLLNFYNEYPIYHYFDLWVIGIIAKLFSLSYMYTIDLIFVSFLAGIIIQNITFATNLSVNKKIVVFIVLLTALNPTFFIDFGAPLGFRAAKTATLLSLFTLMAGIWIRKRGDLVLIVPLLLTVTIFNAVLLPFCLTLIGLFFLYSLIYKKYTLAIFTTSLTLLTLAWFFVMLKSGSSDDSTNLDVSKALFVKLEPSLIINLIKNYYNALTSMNSYYGIVAVLLGFIYSLKNKTFYLLSLFTLSTLIARHYIPGFLYFYVSLLFIPFLIGVIYKIGYNKLKMEVNIFIAVLFSISTARAFASLITIHDSYQIYILPFLSIVITVLYVLLVKLLQKFNFVIDRTVMLFLAFLVTGVWSFYLQHTNGMYHTVEVYKINNENISNLNKINFNENHAYFNDTASYFPFPLKHELFTRPLFLYYPVWIPHTITPLSKNFRENEKYSMDRHIQTVKSFPFISYFEKHTEEEKKDTIAIQKKFLDEYNFKTLSIKATDTKSLKDFQDITKEVIDLSEIGLKVLLLK